MDGVGRDTRVPIFGPPLDHESRPSVLTGSPGIRAGRGSGCGTGGRATEESQRTRTGGTPTPDPHPRVVPRKVRPPYQHRGGVVVVARDAHLEVPVQHLEEEVSVVKELVETRYVPRLPLLVSPAEISL